MYHLDCHGETSDGAIPTEIVHVTEPHDALAAAEKHMRGNPMPPEEVLNRLAPNEHDDIMLSAVQVRGPKKVAVKKHLESV